MDFVSPYVTLVVGWMSNGSHRVRRCIEDINKALYAAWLIHAVYMCCICLFLWLTVCPSICIRIASKYWLRVFLSFFLSFFKDTSIGTLCMCSIFFRKYLSVIFLTNRSESLLFFSLWSLYYCLNVCLSVFLFSSFIFELIHFTCLYITWLL